MCQDEQAGHCAHGKDNSLHPVDKESRQVRVSHSVGNSSAEIFHRPNGNADYGDDDGRLAYSQSEVLYVGDHGNSNQNRAYYPENAVYLVIRRRTLLDETNAVDEHSDSEAEQLEKGGVDLSCRHPSSLLQTGLLSEKYQEGSDSAERPGDPPRDVRVERCALRPPHGRIDRKGQPHSRRSHNRQIEEDEGRESEPLAMLIKVIEDRHSQAQCTQRQKDPFEPSAGRRPADHRLTNG